jgi:hypothetical protein
MTLFRGKLPKIAKNCDHNIDPWSTVISFLRMCGDFKTKLAERNVMYCGLYYQLFDKDSQSTATQNPF